MHIITYTSYNKTVYDLQDNREYPTCITVHTQDLVDSYQSRINTYINKTKKWLPPDAPAHEEQKHIAANLKLITEAQRKGEDVHFDSPEYVHWQLITVLNENKFVKIFCHRCGQHYTPKDVTLKAGTGRSFESRSLNSIYCPQGHTIA